MICESEFPGPVVVIGECCRRTIPSVRSAALGDSPRPQRDPGGICGFPPSAARPGARRRTETLEAPRHAIGLSGRTSAHADAPARGPPEPAARLLAGTQPTLPASLTPSRNSSRTSGVCTTCWATFGSGVETPPGVTTPPTQSQIRSMSKSQRAGSSVVVAGRTPRRACGRRTGVATARAAVTAAWASAAPVQGSELKHRR